MKLPYQFILLLGLCGLTFFAQLNQFETDLMEARNFITAREMLTEGNWLSPTMNGKPRLEKPPLPTWITALSTKYGGGLTDRFAMRFPAAAVATLMVLFFFGLCRQLSREKYLPLLGAAVLATSMLVIQQARTNTWDIYAHAFMVGSIWLLVKGWKSGRWFDFIASGALMGLSILSKGPVAPYAMWLPFMLAYGLGYGTTAFKIYWKQTTVVLLIGLLIGFGWNLYMLAELPNKMEQVLDKETTSWGNRHVRPFYFYLHFALYIGVWSVFMVAAFFYKYAAPRINKWGNYRFTLFLGSTIGFFTIGNSHQKRALPSTCHTGNGAHRYLFDIQCFEGFQIGE